MNGVSENHEAAMRLLDDAAVANRSGNFAHAQELTLMSLERERMAAMALLDREELEPSRSILFRSAATIALRARLPDEAEKLAIRGLLGNPPPTIADELRGVVKDAAFLRRSLDNDFDIDEDEIAVAIDGNAVAFGLAPWDMVKHFADSFHLMVRRTIDRVMDVKFRQKARRASYLPQFVSAPTGGSFQLGIRFASPMSTALPGLSVVSRALGTIIDDLAALEASGTEDVIRRIPDMSYAINFVALAKNLLPDGDSVQTVQLRISGRDCAREAVLRRTRSTVRLPRWDNEPAEVETIEGVLGQADQIANGIVGVKPDSGSAIKVHVRPELIEDIVVPLWGKRVRFEVSKKKVGGKNRYDYLSHTGPESG